MSNNQTITCPACKAQYLMASGLQDRQLIDSELSAVGLLCPVCNHWTHSYYETPEIAQKRAALMLRLELFQKTPAGAKREQRWTEYQTSKAAFARMFDCEQQRLRGKYLNKGGNNVSQNVDTI